MSTPKNHGKPWTKEDIAILKRMSKTRPVGIIAYELGRTEDSIYAKASQEGISLMPINRSPYNKH